MFSVVVIVTVAGACLAAEPACSPFDYENKLLTKMIRQEFVYEKLKEDMFALQKQVIDQLKELSNERNSLKIEIKEDIMTLQSQVTDRLNALDRERASFTTEVDNQRKTFRQEFEDMVADNTKLMERQKEKIQKPKADSSSAVAFVSKDVTDTSPSKGQTFVFGTTTLNEGSGYDNTTGQFTAPVGGLYKFNIQLCLYAGRSNSIFYVIMANNKKIQGGFMSDYDTSNCNTADALIRLESGDKVWVKCGPGGCRGTMAQDIHYFNTFSGFRIHA